MSTFKRYRLAFLILFSISFLMFLGTLGVYSLGDKLVRDSNGAINPNEVSQGLK
jgi:hypothetical protein